MKSVMFSLAKPQIHQMIQGHPNTTPTLDGMGVVHFLKVSFHIYLLYLAIPLVSA
jgi:hypothetical protein